MVISFLLALSVAWPISTVSAQSSGYSIDRVDHQIQVMYSGHIVLLDTIHISGQVTDGFLIGLPYQYSDDVLEGFAYDDTHVYQLNLGVPLGNQTGFYGAEVNFNGNSPSIFTVAFVLSNRLVTEQADGSYTVDFPAYPSLAEEAATCNVNLLFPSSPILMSINKDDGIINSGSYSKSALPSYTYSIANATAYIATGTLQLATITNLDRQITIDPTGKVAATDTYQITSNSKSVLNSFVFSLPLDAQNIAITDQFNRQLAVATQASASGQMQLANTTLISYLNSNESTTLSIEYNLASARVDGASYMLNDFGVFPRFSYYVNQATVTFTPPEGATITAPTVVSLDSSSTLTRQTYQDTLTITEKGSSYVDYLVPQQNNIAFAFDYNPVWVSFRLTFWAAFGSVICCVGAVLYRWRFPKEETYEKLAAKKHAETVHTAVPYEIKAGQRVTIANLRDFVENYEAKKQLTAELRTLDQNARKGKIPRRQYKVQRQAIEIRLDGINRNIHKTKEVFLSSSGSYGDFVRQLDLAEADLDQADENIRNIEERQNKGDVSLENYKKNLAEYQKRKEKAESAINGILMRLREKIPKNT